MGLDWVLLDWVGLGPLLPCKSVWKIDLSCVPKPNGAMDGLCKQFILDKQTNKSREPKEIPFVQKSAIQQTTLFLVPTNSIDEMQTKVFSVLPMYSASMFASHLSLGNTQTMLVLSFTVPKAQASNLTTV